MCKYAVFMSWTFFVITYIPQILSEYPTTLPVDVGLGPILNKLRSKLLPIDIQKDKYGLYISRKKALSLFDMSLYFNQPHSCLSCHRKNYDLHRIWYAEVIPQSEQLVGSIQPWCCHVCLDTSCILVWNSFTISNIIF